MRIEKALVAGLSHRDAKDRSGRDVRYENVELVDRIDGGVIRCSWVPMNPSADKPRLNEEGAAIIKARQTANGLFLDCVDFVPFVVADSANGVATRDKVAA